MPKKLLYLGSLLFIISVLVLNIASLQQFDFALVEFLSTQRTAHLNQLAQLLSVLGGMPFVLFLSSLWCFYWVWYKKYTKIVFISVGLFGSIAIAWLLKSVIARPRPPEALHLVESYGAAFPSAHSFYAASLGCLVIYLSLQHPAHRILTVCAALWMVLMGISRVYLGVHYPSDVLSGWSISFIWITLWYLFCTKYLQCKPIHKFR
ncbi:phosphatase PAP2 family protein [Acinetobacter towneri]|uniref:phosphatase PAP2 family protein n=1 Tax=Acinetobacter towneri TaxID=202956 RepID=UPI002576BD43|nr:phosphatase PAP2 family protein [Acinetobacter towneri]MDM1485714.1 phosphatase PAP2 family protein [Acinetobacter towneri]